MTRFAFFKKQVVPIDQAKISIMTHAFNYGTGVFEGIRGNWNPAENKIFIFRMPEHYERFKASCKILRLNIPYSVEELCEITKDLVARNGFREDVYIRPIAYKASEAIGVKLHGLEDDLAVFVTPLGPYLDAEGGIRACTSSWRRIDDTMIPARAKVTGLYVNSALAKTEANESGFDEAILLTSDGHVSEGSGENIFLVIKGKLVTPPVSDNILVGITRDTVIRLAAEELGIETVERSVDRSELYVADEVFMTGTAAHVTPVVEIDRRPVGDGQVGPVTRKLMELYFAVIRGQHPKYLSWCTPVAPSLASV